MEILDMIMSCIAFVTFWVSFVAFALVNVFGLDMFMNVFSVSFLAFFASFTYALGFASKKLQDEEQNKTDNK